MLLPVRVSASSRTVVSSSSMARDVAASLKRKRALRSSSISLEGVMSRVKTANRSM
jgi:hypothetical protein